MSTRSLAKSGSKDDPRSSSARRLSQRMSALPLKADICSALADVRKGPKTEMFSVAKAKSRVSSGLAL